MELVSSAYTYGVSPTLQILIMVVNGVFTSKTHFNTETSTTDGTTSPNFQSRMVARRVLIKELNVSPVLFPVPRQLAYSFILSHHFSGFHRHPFTSLQSSPNLARLCGTRDSVSRCGISPRGLLLQKQSRGAGTFFSARSSRVSRVPLAPSTYSYIIHKQL